MAHRLQSIIRRPGLSLSAIAWLLLWLNLNSGPWNLTDRTGFWGQLNAIRAALPLLVLFMVLAVAAGTRPIAPGFGFSSIRWLQIYSLIALAAACFSPKPAYAFYFGVVHFLAIAVSLQLSREQPSNRTPQIWLIVNLAITTLWAVGVIWVGRGIIFGAGPSAYGIYNELEEVAGMPMSRSSGIARFAAVPLIVTTAWAWRDRGWRRGVWAAGAWLFAFVVYRMQSRGALIGTSVALSWLCLLGPRRRWPVWLLGLSIVVLAMQPSLRQAAHEYLRRGQDAAEFRSFTGRTHVWGGAGAALRVSPIFGSGHFADRLLLGANAHNALLYAGLTAGLCGLAPFLLSWVCAWRDGWRLWRARKSLPQADQDLLLITGGLLLFFTIRSIPEITTAGFSADLLILLPVLAYLDATARPARWRPKAAVAGASRIDRRVKNGQCPASTSLE